MDKMKERTVLSESEEKPKQNKTEENVSDKINGNGLLELIHDTIGRITDILQGVSDDAKPEEAEDVVEFKKDSDEAEGAVGGACEALPLDIAEPFEVLNDDDFAKDDPVVNTFNNDMGGCGKIVKVVRISAKEALGHSWFREHPLPCLPSEIPQKASLNEKPRDYSHLKPSKNPN